MDSTIRTDDAALHLATFGSDDPVTLFAHGLGATIDETRPLASGVLGTRAFVHLRGHGASSAWGPAEDRWTYAAVTRDLAAAQRATRATRALGVSLGAAALIGLVAQQPTLLERCVFFLPAVVDVPRTDAAFARLQTLADLVDARDVAGLETFLTDELPAEVRDTPGARAYLAGRARTLAGGPVGQLVRGLTPDVPVPDVARLRRVTARCLVVGQEGDPLHTVAAAERLASLLPDARLHVFPRAGAIWTDRAALRDLLTGFLNEP